MYLGMLMIILSTSIFYLNILYANPFLFILWINKFQIKEEDFLTEKFGRILSYKKKTRRWI